jgi:hypothetical protein
MALLFEPSKKLPAIVVFLMFLSWTAWAAPASQ